LIERLKEKRQEESAFRENQHSGRTTGRRPILGGNEPRKAGAGFCRLQRQQAGADVSGREQDTVANFKKRKKKWASD
jgi:hypothetical protein